MKKILWVFIAAAVSLAPGYSQITCNLSSAAPQVRDNGGSELTGDLVMTCNNSGPSSSALVNIELFLNVPLTSRILNTTTQLSEGLLMIDDPQPGVSNVSNTFGYFGQVLGTPGVLAGDPGSGNVYQATQNFDNAILWQGIPYVTGGTRTFRFTNIRADTSVLQGPGTIQAVVSVSGPVALTVTGESLTVATSLDGLKFTSVAAVSALGVLDLRFAEEFPAAFKKRIENTNGGPLTASYQDVPGTAYCTESGFTPEFATLTAGDIGSANTGTRLLAEISNVPPATFAFLVPNEVVSSTGNLVAHRVAPPLGTDFASGTVLTSIGVSLAPVSATHTAQVLYEVTAASPFLGKNSCGVLDSFNIPLIAFFPASLAKVKVTGRLAPVDGTLHASATAVEPRFVP